MQFTNNCIIDEYQTYFAIHKNPDGPMVDNRSCFLKWEIKYDHRVGQINTCCYRVAADAISIVLYALAQISVMYYAKNCSI